MPKPGSFTAPKSLAANGRILDSPSKYWYQENPEYRRGELCGRDAGRSAPWLRRYEAGAHESGDAAVGRVLWPGIRRWSGAGLLLLSVASACAVGHAEVSLAIILNFALAHLWHTLFLLWDWRGIIRFLSLAQADADGRLIARMVIVQLETDLGRSQVLRRRDLAGRLLAV